MRRDHVCERVKSGSHFCFLSKQNLGGRERDTSFVGEISFHFKKHLPRRTIYKKKKKKMARIQRMEGKCFQKLSLKRSLITVSNFYPPFWLLSLFIHSIFNLSHKAHYSSVPAAIAVRLSELLAIHSTLLQYP